MAWWNKKKNEEEETGRASSSGGSAPRVIEAAKNLYQQAVAQQERAVRADMAVQRAQTQRVQQAAQGLYSAYQQQQEQQARAQMQQQGQARTAARNLYSALAAPPTPHAQQAAQGLYSAYMQGREQTVRENAETAQRLYLRTLDPTYGLDREAADAAADRYRGLYIDPVTARANERQSSLAAGDPNRGAGRFAAVQAQPDFAAASQARTDTGDALYNYINDLNGEQLRQQAYATQRGALSGYEKYTLMTEEEKGVYNYLYNTRGQEAAAEYIAALEPELNEQWYSGQSAYESEQANRDTASRIGYSAATVAQQPVRTLSSAAAFVDDVINTATGKEIDPNGEFRRASALTQDIRGAISEALDKKYPKKILGLGAGDLYQNVCSALDSTMNRMVSGFLGEGIAAAQGISDVKAIDKLTSRLAGILMSGEVTATTIAEGKKKGYSNMGATSLGVIRGGLEYLFEAIGGETVTSLIRTQPGTILNAIIQVMFSEGIEEVATDIGNEGVSLLADALFDTDESFLRQTHDAFEREGSDNPWRDTWAMAGLQLWKSFSGGALSSFGTAGVTYARQSSTVNAITKQLNTDRKGVQNLMRELGTDNPSAVEFMAEAFGTNSVEELREKAAQFENVEAAIDAAMREQREQEGQAAPSSAEQGSAPSPQGEGFAAENNNALRERSALDVDTEGVLNNGEQSDNRGSELGNDALGAGGEGLRNEAGAQRGAVDAGDEVGQRRDRVAHYGVKEEVTPASLGITNGSTAQRVQVLDEATFEAGSPEAQAAQRARQMGLEPVFVRGTMEVGGKQVRGYIQGKRVILQADGKYSADQILRHEEYHDAARRNPQLNRIVREALANNLSDQELHDLVGRYITAYDGVYDFSGMTQAEIEALIEEELFADLYAGIDNTGRDALREDARRGYAQAQTEQGQNAEAQQDTTGPPEGRASYAGPKAKTANSTTLQQAEQMEKDGRSNEEIRQETGWFRGSDGQWRFEIDDSGAKYYRNGDAQFRKDHPEYARYQELMSQFLNGSLNTDELAELQQLEQTWGREQARLKKLVDSGRATLGMILDHSELFDAYPELKEARVRFADVANGNGYYSRKNNNITLSNELRNAPESTLIHEIQHAIQGVEGFSGGASVEYWENQERSGRVAEWKSDATKELESKYQTLLESLPEEIRDLIRDVKQAYADNDFDRIDALEDRIMESSYGNQYFNLQSLEGKILNHKDADRKTNAQANYYNTAGEIEARDAANRRNMTDEERKNTPPDLGDENTVFADGDSGLFMSEENMLTEDDLEDYLKTGTRENKAKQRALNAGKKIILTSETEIRGYIQDAIHNGGRNSAPAAYGRVDSRLAQDTLAESNGSIDISGSYLELNPYDLQHSFDEHHQAKMPGDIDLTEEDYENIPRYLEGYDEILYARTYANNEKSICVSKRITNGRILIIEIASKSRNALQFKNAIGVSETKYNNEILPKYGKSQASSRGSNSSKSTLRNAQASSTSIVTQQNDNSNPQNKASVEVPGADPRRELARLQREYRDATERADPDYDYEGQYARIKELQRQAEAAPHPSPAATASPQGEGYPDSHPERGEIGKDGVRVCKDTEALEAEINEIGKAKLRNDTGEYFARVRSKADGGVLLTIDHDGKRQESRRFDNAEQAAAYARDYINGQTNARTDAELDQNKSEKIPQQTMTEALFSGERQNEYERIKKNKAAEMSTQALRERMKKTDAEIRALRRLEKTTGLSETQKSHMEDLRQSLEILNDELKSRKGRAKAKKEKVHATGNKPTQSAAEAKNAMMDTFHTAQGQRAELGRQLDRRLEKIAESGKITESDRSEILDMLMDAGAVREEAAEELRDVRQWLRGARIYVSEHDRADFGDNWNELRRRAWAAGIYLTDNMTDRKADSLNAELAETFGEGMFPTDAALSDMLSNLVDKAEAGRSRMIPFASAIENEARGMRMDPQEIYNELSQKLDETLRTYAEKARLEVELKNRTASQLATERKRMEDRLERQAQRRRESEIREKTLKALRRLEKLRGKAASDVRAQIDEALKDIDTQARSLTMSGIEDLQALQQAYEDAKKAAGWIDEENPGNFLRNPYVEEKLARLTKKHLNDMDISDVIELGRVVAALENTVRTQNQMIGEEFDQTIKETADAVDREVKDVKVMNRGFLQKWFMEEHLSPRRFLDMLGGWKKGAMSKLSDSLEKGQTRMLDFQRRASQSFDPFVSKAENRKWLETASGKKATWSTYGVANGLAMDGSGITGQSIEITPMMKIALYLHSLNEDNLRHIQTGGLVIPNKELYIKGKIQEAYAQGERVKMQPQAVRAIASTLTQQEKTFAGYLQKFFNEQSKAAINEVSVQLDGFERAGVDNYFPIESSRSFLASDVAGEARAQTVEGIGSIANERVHASNPIMLSDATDVLTRQIDKVSRYYGYAIPIRNFQAVNNYVFHEEGNAFAGSIKDTINRQWGAGAENYITKMLQDLQSSGRRSDMMGSALAKLRGNLAGATLMFNPSVAVSQAASYPGAAQAVGWDGLAAGLVAGPVDTKLIEKYTPLYWYRNQGNSTQELGDAIKEKGLEQKLPWAMNWIQKMDSFTIRRIWAAAEYRVQKDNPGLKPGSKAEIDAGTDEYYRKVAEVFDRAVYDTQPNYTNMERAQILRSDSDMTKFLTMYKTVPLQYYGMTVEAIGRLQAAHKSGSKAEIAAAQKYAANTFGGLLAANSVYVMMKALFKSFRKKDDDYRDEEGNLTAGSVTKQLSKDLMETYAGSIIGGAEAYSIAESMISGNNWTAPEISALSHLEDIFNGAQSVFGAIGDEDPRKAAKAIKNTALNVAMGFGLPAKNVETYLLAAIRWISPKTVMEYDNLFGGVGKADLRKMDENTLGIGTNLILRTRTGEDLDRSATDELSRLYAQGYTNAVPGSIPTSFTYDGNEVPIDKRSAYSKTWGSVVGDNLEELLASRDYRDADDETKAAMVNKLYQYATVQARKGADPTYSAEGNSTYGWTVKADAAVEAGIPVHTAVTAITAMNSLRADKNENGKSISGSKKQKVSQYINSLDLSVSQKDMLFSTLYTNGVEDAPWHGGSGKYAKGYGGGGGGGRAAVPKTTTVKADSVGRPEGGFDSFIDIRTLFGSTAKNNKASAPKSAGAGMDLLEIVNKYYAGNLLAAALDGGQKARAKGRTKVDFKL